MDVRELGPSQLLDQWRSAEKRLSARDPDSSDFEDMLREVDRLRLEYQHLTLGAVAVADQLHAAARETRRRLSRSVDASSDARARLRSALRARPEQNAAS